MGYRSKEAKLLLGVANYVAHNRTAVNTNFQVKRNVARVGRVLGLRKPRLGTGWQVVAH